MKRQSKKLGQRMLAARESRGLSQAQLAKKLGHGADATQISRWERGYRTPRAETLGDFCVVLKVDGHWLLTGDGGMDRVTDLMPIQLEVVGKIASGVVTRYDLDRLIPLVSRSERRVKPRRGRSQRVRRAARVLL